MTVIDEKLISSLIPVRDESGDKRSFGRLLSVCGSDLMPGAAILSSRAALRSGVGLMRLLTTEKAVSYAVTAAPECVFCPAKSHSSGAILFESGRTFIQKHLPDSTAVLFGCGLSVSDEGAKLLSFIIESLAVPLIIDADGLNILAKCPELLENAHGNIIITPHGRELARLCSAFGLTAAEISEKYSLTAVCKGSETRVYSQKEEYLLSCPDSALAKGGSGDVLAGIIASLCAQGASVRDAALCGVYIHSRAGLLVRNSLSAYSALPSDIIEALPRVFAELTSEAPVPPSA